MRIILILSLFLSFSFAQILSKEKKELFNIQRQKAKKESDKLSTKWISPLNLNAEISKNDSLKDNSKFKEYSISWRQDLFRSGGIFYAIQYAKALKSVNLSNIDLKEALEIKKAYILKAKIERDKIKLKKANLLLKNRQIDVLIIKEKYKAGSADIARLNQAILQEERAKEDIVTLQNIIESELFDLKKLIGENTDKKMDFFNIPLLSKKEYIKQNIALLEKQSEILAKRKELLVKKASYLPKISFNSKIGYAHSKSSFFEDKGRVYNYGLNIHMPIDYNEKKDIEISRLDYLQSEILKEDLKRELSFEYDKRINNIKSYKEKIKLSNKREKIYKELFDFTKNSLKAGLKTKLDLQSLSNSLKIEKLEKEIQKYNILIEKISLYFDTVK